VQPARASSRDSTHTLFREARDAYNPFGAPEEEGSLRGLQESEEEEVIFTPPGSEYPEGDDDDWEEEEEEEEEDADFDEDV